MLGLRELETLYVATAFLFQIILVVYFSLRKWRFPFAMRYGWIVYGLSAPAASIGVVLLLGGAPWSLWLGGLLYLAWAVYGYTVEYIKRIQWRGPIRWPVLGPYVTLYLATIMFYWWPLAQIHRALWYVQAALFVLSTVLNLISHQQPQGPRRDA